VSSRCFWALALVAGLVACSPSLNWRKVPVAQLAALLPCKPDHAERQVELAGAQRTLAIWGCEAEGALFAVSHVRVDAMASAELVIAAWQLAALRNMPGATAQSAPFQAPVLTSQRVEPGVLVRTKGKRADGQALQGQLVWFSRGADVYHLALYATEITPAMTDSFFTDLRWQ
jgi:hypothetical protein